MTGDTDLWSRIIASTNEPVHYSIDICFGQNMFSILTQISVSILSVKTVIFKAI